ncbi:hypothetical protein C482_13760 [Natrialba chahannaoensis JCM 10990]|uniref:Uncharacterized protein n=1 Tax=Natrialba chahannaoensis JCM 10990 TaxID=1227492 RepID=M0AFH9_9EURY|nr:helix-turn-helix domain-containing protein [Natrialba chahannaoensis]ELY97304.1 hypothetical protein C482_13760 [Natrialba chahannaoensis JCM 10990]
MPRAILHKKVLDVAASRPDASLEELADDVSGATVSIVEQVLEEFGDPGESADEGEDEDQRTAKLTTDQDSDDGSGETPVSTDGAPTTSDTADDSTMTTDNSTDVTPDEPTDPATLTPRQRETLQEIAARPDATQAALAETLEVTSATISQRVNSIDGFEWSRRREFVADLFDDEGECEGEGDGDDEDKDEDEDSAVETVRDHEDDRQSESSAEDGADDEGLLESEPNSAANGNRIENEGGAESVDGDTDNSASEAVDTADDGTGQQVVASESDAGAGAGSERSDDDSTGDTYDSRRFSRQETPADEPTETADSAAGSGSETGARMGISSGQFPGTATGTDTVSTSGIDATTETKTDTAETETETVTAINNLATTIATLSEQLESLESTMRSPSSDRQDCLADPEFAHKVLRACFDADHITEEDEVRLLRDIAGEGGDSSSGSTE